MCKAVVKKGRKVATACRESPAYLSPRILVFDRRLEPRANAKVSMMTYIMRDPVPVVLLNGARSGLHIGQMHTAANPPVAYVASARISDRTASRMSRS
jgi:hypothetical protein